jgi:hypothetical protein
MTLKNKLSTYENKIKTILAPYGAPNYFSDQYSVIKRAGAI